MNCSDVSVNKLRLNLKSVYTACVFPTQGRVISISIVKRDDGVGDWYISIKRTKATFSRSRNHDDNIWVHGGFEGKLNAS